MTLFSYKESTWPCNLRSLKVTPKVIPNHSCNSWIYIRGNGEFSGEGAYEKFKKLAAVFYENEAGRLVLPTSQTSENARFMGLCLCQEPREDYVSYEFTFAAPKLVWNNEKGEQA